MAKYGALCNPAATYTFTNDRFFTVRQSQNHTEMISNSFTGVVDKKLQKRLTRERNVVHRKVLQCKILGRIASDIG